LACFTSQRGDLPGALPTFGHLAEWLAPDVALQVIQQASTKASQQDPVNPTAKESALQRCLAVSNATALGSGLRPEHLAILNIVVPNDGGYLQALLRPCTYRFQDFLVAEVMLKALVGPGRAVSSPPECSIAGIERSLSN
jgi:hypothetical protein